MNHRIKRIPEKGANLNIPEGTIIADTLLHLLKFNTLNQVYSELHDKGPIHLIDSLFEKLDIKFEIPEEDLKSIPASGPFIIVSNHPYRGIDSMFLYKIVSAKRPDFKIMASHILQEIEPLKDMIIAVKTNETAASNKSSLSGLKEAITHIRSGNSIGIFPTGEDAGLIEVSKVILDKEWQLASLKFIKNAEVPVIPVYFHGTNSRISYITGQIPSLNRSVRLPSEILHRKNKIVQVRIGSQVTLKEQNQFTDIARYGRYLRARTYSLGSALEIKKFFVPRHRMKKLKAEPVADAVHPGLLTEEYSRVKPDFELFSTKNYSVVCAPTNKIPLIFSEIGRLRELTFRSVGEGTNKSTDIDEYDFYFNHLFIWDTAEKKIVGAYRIGRGDEIMSVYGIKGFYINSLFRIKKSFSSHLNQSLELGRSFITIDYQKKAIPLFLLWKGIMVFLLRNKEYRYLIGPVSISNDFSKYSKSLIVEFIMKYFTDEKLSAGIIPRKKFIAKADKAADRNIIIETSEHDINKIEKIIMDVEPGYRLPVLLKRYLEINGKIIGFNIDPKFNYCLDGLLILDLFNTPPEIIRGLARELNDDSILERFREE
jgi:putative hemolysin